MAQRAPLHPSCVTRTPLLPYDEARAAALALEWRAGDIAAPDFTGCRTVDDCSAADLVPFIDWTPLFHAWELRGVYPRILDDARFGAIKMRLQISRSAAPRATGGRRGLRCLP